MEQTSIGTSSVHTSRIGLGTWAIGGSEWGGTDEAESVATIRSAVERGVTLIDTAPVYGFGRSEEIVGNALAEGGLRGRVQIATKAGLAWRDGVVYRDSRPARLRSEIEASLRRLRTDTIDLYQVHWPDLETPIEETARTLEELRREGKIRAIGVSNYSPAQMAVFHSAARLDAVQSPYNLFEREIEADVLPYARRTGLNVLSYSVLCRGLLSGRMSAATSFHGDDLRKELKLAVLQGAQKVDEVLLIRGAQSLEVGNHLIGFAPGAGMVGDRLDQVAGPAVMKEKHPLADTPERRGAELIGTGRSLGDAIGEAHAHVMYQQIREKCRLLVRQCGARWRGRTARHGNAGRHYRGVAERAADAGKQRAATLRGGGRGCR